MDIPVFVINLKHSVERREHTTKQLTDLGVPFQIIEAIDGTKLSDQEIQNKQSYGIYKCGWNSRYLRKEEKGCTLSHLKIYRKMIDENIAIACILEDDNDYMVVFKELLNYKKINIHDWDLLYLGHHSGYLSGDAQCKDKKQILPFNYYICEPVELPYGSYAYIIKLEAAGKLLSRAYPVSLPFDMFLGNAPAAGIGTFLLSPPCIIPSPGFSSTIINDGNILYLNSFWKVTWGQLRKIYIWFPFLRTFTIWIYVNRNFIKRYFRKKGVVKNSYAKY